MTYKKDFETTAAILKAKRDLITGIYTGETGARMTVVIDEIARDFAVAYERDNPRFRRDQFLTACGIK
jgi:hypothetical protein